MPVVECVVKCVVNIGETVMPYVAKDLEKRGLRYACYS